VLQGIVSGRIPEGEERQRAKLEQAIQIIEVLTSNNRKVTISPEDAADLMNYLGDPDAWKQTLLVAFNID
jgi:hypothetical protein